MLELANHTQSNTSSMNTLGYFTSGATILRVLRRVKIQAREQAIPFHRINQTRFIVITSIYT